MYEGHCLASVVTTLPELKRTVAKRKKAKRFSATCRRRVNQVQSRATVMPLINLSTTYVIVHHHHRSFGPVGNCDYYCNFGLQQRHRGKPGPIRPNFNTRRLRHRNPNRTFGLWRMEPDSNSSKSLKLILKICFSFVRIRGSNFW